LAQFAAIAFLGFACLPGWADPSLATAKNCMSCHAIDKVQLGPSFNDIARKYASQKNASEQLALKIRNGSQGVWGASAMPANAQLDNAQARALANWILSLK
jgi:cytochrome c